MSWKTIESPAGKTRYKFFDTNSPYIKRLHVIIQERRKIVKCTYLVRDGHLVKACNKISERHITQIVNVYDIVLPSIKARNVGALYDKFNIPPSTRKVINTAKHKRMLCTRYDTMLALFDGCIEHVNQAYSLKIFQRFRMLENKLYSPRLIKMFDKLTPKRKLEAFENYANLMDSLSSITQIQYENPELLDTVDWKVSFQQIHDQLYRIADKLRNPDRDIPIEYPDETQNDFKKANVKLAERMDAQTRRGEWRLKLAKDGNELLEWGQKLDHCIGGYTSKALDQAKNLYALVGVYKPNDDMPCFTAEMKKKNGIWVVMQLQGKISPPPDLADLISEVMI